MSRETRVRGAFPGAALIALASLACAAPQVPEVSAQDYIAEIETHREQRIERLKTSWLTIAGLYWLEPGDNAFGGAPENAVALPADAAPAVAGKFIYDDGQVTLVPDPAAGLTVDGGPATRIVLETDGDAQQIGLGRLTFFVIERSGRHGIRLRDPEFSALKEFQGIEFYPIDPVYSIEGHLEPYDEPKNVLVETVIGSDAEMISLGRLKFDLAGKTHSLEALAGSAEDEELFLIFKDETTGTETYAAGRYLYAPIDGRRVRLDFNRAYNPPCAFTPHATCPLPPAGNTVPTPIRAGEMAYHPD